MRPVQLTHNLGARSDFTYNAYRALQRIALVTTLIAVSGAMRVSPAPVLREE